MKSVRAVLKVRPPRRAFNPTTRLVSTISSSSTPRLSRTRGRALNSSLAVEPSSGSSLLEQSIFNSPNAISNHPNRNSPHQGRSVNYYYLICLFEDPPELVTPLNRYKELIQTGVLRGDDHQTRIIQKLQDLHDRLANYDPPHIPDPSQSNSLVCISC